jgi:putative FmdB family regulatory protein
MPLYDYQCPDCGVFDDFRSASRAAEPAKCPRCGFGSPRVIRAPQLLEMNASLRTAHEVNERSAHEPRFSNPESREHRHDHGPGCSCCGGSEMGKSSALYHADGSKTFPTKRPWMISH